MTELERKENAIIFDIYNKIQNRANAKLTKEEKDIMAKYNIYRIDKKLYVGNYCILDEKFLDNRRFHYHYSYKSKKYVDGYNVKKVVNIVDRARKANEREYSHTVNNHCYWGNNNFLEKEKFYIYNEHFYKMSTAKSTIHDIKYYQNKLNNVHNEYNNKRMELLKQLEDLERQEEHDRKFYARQVISYKEYFEKIKEKILDK